MPPHARSGPARLLRGAALLLPLVGFLAEIPPAGAESPDGVSCGADRLAGLIGQPEGALAGVATGGPLRVVHPGEAVTMDWNPARLTVGIDAGGRIASLRCG